MGKNEEMTDNEQEETWLTEAKQSVSEQADWLAEIIVKDASDLNFDLEWYANEVIKQLKKNIKNKLGE